MIEMLTGELIQKEPARIIISCGGVGFGVIISSHTYSSLGDIGSVQTLHTFFKVREDDMSLYGFSDKKEKELFLHLSSVSGIGPRTAIQVLSEIKYDRLFTAITSADVTLISQAHGVGKKTAQKIVFELKDRIGSIDGISALGAVMGTSSENSEAVTALVRLGYKNADANIAVARIIKEKGKEISTQEIVKTVLMERMKN